MQPLTISQLERVSGFGRDTIHFYIRQGLLPPAQKASATRSIYDRSHVDVLQEIARLKAEGLSLKAIRARLQDRLQAAAQNGVDLVAKQSETTRAAILETAARRFAERGYERTRISDLCKEVGVTAQVLYSHFPSKRHLFISCYRVYYQWMYAQVQPSVESTADLNARLAWRSWASFGIQSLSPDLQAMARVEAVHPQSDLRPLVHDLYAEILESTVEELKEERRPEDGSQAGAGPGLLDEELVAYAFIGALENMQMRASWDDRYTRRDVMRNLLAMYMAVRAALSGGLDLAEEWAAVAGLVDSLAATPPEVHPAPAVAAAAGDAPTREVPAESPPSGSLPPG
jgi:AcrR family transcriptional regulator